MSLFCFEIRKLFESWGGGIELVDMLSQESGNPAPQFFERSGGFCASLPFKQTIVIEQTQIESVKFDTSVLNSRQEEILQLLKQGGLLGVREINLRLSKPVSLRTLNGDMSLLQSNRMVESQGQGPSTKWKLK